MFSGLGGWGDAVGRALDRGDVDPGRPRAVLSPMSAIGANRKAAMA
jgi:hypothetical protein